MKFLNFNIEYSDCCIVAIYNATKWCKIDSEYLKIKKIAEKYCNYSNQLGMTISNFKKLLKTLKIPAKSLCKNNLEEIQENLYIGKAMLILYKSKQSQKGHATMAFLDKEYKIRIVNSDGKLNTWNELASEINAEAMSRTEIWELPNQYTLNTKH